MVISKEKQRYLVSIIVFLTISFIAGMYIKIALDSPVGPIYLLLLLPFLILFGIPLFQKDFHRTSFKIGVLFAYLTFIPLWVSFTVILGSDGSNGMGAAFALIFFVWPLMGVFTLVSWISLLVCIFKSGASTK